LMYMNKMATIRMDKFIYSRKLVTVFIHTVQYMDSLVYCMTTVPVRYKKNFEIP
jgi:hypothetical protein